jgi:hypothetical protein
MTEENAQVPVNKGGRPPHEPDERTRAIVESVVAFGITQDDIAAHLGINGDTLRKHYRKELNEGVFKAHMKVGGVILDLALRSTDETVSFAPHHSTQPAAWAGRRLPRKSRSARTAARSKPRT